MSKIVIVIESVGQEINYIKGLRTITDRSVTDLKRCIEQKVPLYEVELFLNDHEQVADTINKILKLTNDTGGKVRLFEISRLECFEQLTDVEPFEINESILKNIIKS